MKKDTNKLAGRSESEWMRAAVAMAIFGIPRNWLYKFAAAHPRDFIKVGGAQSSTALWRASAIRSELERMAEASTGSAA